MTNFRAPLSGQAIHERGDYSTDSRATLSGHAIHERGDYSSDFRATLSEPPFLVMQYMKEVITLLCLMLPRLNCSVSAAMSLHNYFYDTFLIKKDVITDMTDAKSFPI